MQIKCPCGQFYTVADDAGGKTCVCQKCGRQIAIPMLATAQVELVPAQPLSQGAVRPVFLKFIGALILLIGVVLTFFFLFIARDPRGYLFCSLLAVIGLVLVGFGIAMDRKK